jgi:hypothetical protein
MSDIPLMVKIKQTTADGRFRYFISSDYMGDYGFAGTLHPGQPVLFSFDEIFDLKEYLEEILKEAGAKEAFSEMPWIFDRLRMKKYTEKNDRDSYETGD